MIIKSKAVYNLSSESLSSEQEGVGVGEAEGVGGVTMILSLFDIVVVLMSRSDCQAVLGGTLSSTEQTLCPTGAGQGTGFMATNLLNV